jgi:hypothetical protein
MRKAEINNFIGVYDNYIPSNMCEEVIKYFNLQSEYKNTFDRLKFENVSLNIKQDEACQLNKFNLHVWFKDFKTLLLNFDQALQHYQTHTGFKDHVGELEYTTIKIQKTNPTQGYHVWHVEKGGLDDHAVRSLVYTIYLNDIEEGGETEFLHFSKRVQPKTGRIVIWPAGFPYVHRGNPPLSKTKYIMTSWMMEKRI